MTSGNAIIEIGPDHVDPSTVPAHIDPNDLHLKRDEIGHLADMLADIGADGQSAILEIERRHTIDNPKHTLRFTAKELTSVAIALSIAYTVNFYHGNNEPNRLIEKFGYMIDREVSAPLDGAYANLSIDGMAPYTGEQETVDPFQVIRGEQRLAFLDGNGEPIPPGEPERLEYYDPDKHQTHDDFQEMLDEHFPSE